MTDFQKAKEGAINALHSSMDVADGLDIQSAEKYLAAALSAFREAGYVLVPVKIKPDMYDLILRGWAYKPYCGPKDTSVNYWSALKQWDIEKVDSAHAAMLTAAQKEQEG